MGKIFCTWSLKPNFGWLIAFLQVFLKIFAKTQHFWALLKILETSTPSRIVRHVKNCGVRKFHALSRNSRQFSTRALTTPSLLEQPLYSTCFLTIQLQNSLALSNKLYVALQISISQPRLGQPPFLFTSSLLLFQASALLPTPPFTFVPFVLC